MPRALAFAAALAVTGCAARFDAPVVAAAGDGEGACAVVAPGRVHCWYKDERFWVPGLDDAERVAAQQDRGCALRRGGAVSCWYYSAWLSHRDVHVAAVAVDPARRVLVTEADACAQLVDGGVACWKIGRADEPIRATREPRVAQAEDLAVYYGEALALVPGGRLAHFYAGTPGNLWLDRTEPAAARLALGDHFTCLTRAGGWRAGAATGWVGSATAPSRTARSLRRWSASMAWSSSARAWGTPARGAATERCGAGARTSSANAA